MVVAAARVRLNAITATPSPTNGIKSLPHLLPATAPTPAGACPAPGRARFHLADSSERRNAWSGARCFMVGAGGPGSLPLTAQRQVFERLIARGVSNSVSGGRDQSADGDTVAVRAQHCGQRMLGPQAHLAESGPRTRTSPWRPLSYGRERDSMIILTVGRHQKLKMGPHSRCLAVTCPDDQPDGNPGVDHRWRRSVTAQTG